MKRGFKFLSAVLSVSLFLTVFLSTAASANNIVTTNVIETPYTYPITTSSPEWLKLESHAERVNVCQIPENILSNMSTPALLETIYNYPLLVDLLLFDRAEDAYQIISTGFNGIEELNNRPNALESIMAYVEQNQAIRDDFIRSAAFGVIALNISNTLAFNSSEDSPTSQVRQRAISSIFTDAYTIYPELKNTQFMSSTATATNAQSSEPKTPSGYSLTVYTIYDNTPELTQTQKNNLEEEILATYGLYPAGEATAKYNCHSYAWHDQSANNLWWIDYPDDYINDPLVTRVYSPRVGDRIVYQRSSSSRYLHSGIITIAQNNVVMIKSKWGRCGLYNHTIDNCPTDYGRYTTYWHIN